MGRSNSDTKKIKSSNLYGFQVKEFFGKVAEWKTWKHIMLNAFNIDFFLLIKISLSDIGVWDTSVMYIENLFQMVLRKLVYIIIKIIYSLFLWWIWRFAAGKVLCCWVILKGQSWFGVWTIFNHYVFVCKTSTVWWTYWRSFLFIRWLCVIYMWPMRSPVRMT